MDLDIDSFYEFEMFFEEMFEQLGPVIEVVLALAIAVVLFAAVLGIVMYVLRSVALYTIATRRGLRNPWLSWIPVGQEWIIGSLSDQYQYVTAGKVNFRRKILLGLAIGSAVIGALNGIVSEMLLWMENSAVQASAMLLTVSAVFGMLSTAVGIVNLVFRHMSMYDLYRSCNPKNAVTFLVLGIIFGFTEPFFLMACRKKDLGMPPRKRAASGTTYTNAVPKTATEMAEEQASAAGVYTEITNEMVQPEPEQKNPDLIPLLPLTEVDSGDDSVEL